MTHANQILPFATGGGANVMTPADYSALPARSAGFVAGVAESSQLNTVWRQASFVAAMVAQFTADFGPSDVNDDGDLATLEAQFVEALKSFFPEFSLLHYGTAGGTANTITSTVSPTITSLVPGMTFLIKIALMNTGAATLDPSSLGAKTIKRPDGSDLQLGDMEAGCIAVLIYDGTYLQLVGSMFLGNILDHYGVDTSVAADTITVPVLDPPCLALKAGTTFRVKIANTNTGPCTINGGGLGVKNIKSPSGASLTAGQLIANGVATFVYDGTQFWLQTAQALSVANTSGGLTAVATTSPIHGDGTPGNPVAINDASTSGKGAVQTASAAVYQANSYDRALTVQEVWDAASFEAQAFAATVTLDMNAAFNWLLDPVTGAFTLANPTNIKSGQEGLIVIPQDATGGRVMTKGSYWKFPGGFPGLSTGPNAIDAIAYKAVSSTLIICTLLKDCA